MLATHRTVDRWWLSLAMVTDGELQLAATIQRHQSIRLHIASPEKTGIQNSPYSVSECVSLLHHRKVRKSQVEPSQLGIVCMFATGFIIVLTETLIKIFCNHSSDF